MAGLTQADWRNVRVAFEDSDEPVVVIAARYGISRTTLEQRAIEDGWRLRASQPLDRGTDRKDVARRLYDTIDRKLAQLEARMNTDEALSAAEHETETRALGQLIRGFEKVTNLIDESESDGDGQQRAAGVTDERDDPKRLRDELAQRIRRLCHVPPGDSA